MVVPIRPMRTLIRVWLFKFFKKERLQTKKTFGQANENPYDHTFRGSGPEDPRMSVHV